MMYTVEQILQAIATLGAAEKKRLWRELSKGAEGKDAVHQLKLDAAATAESVQAGGEPDYLLVFDGGSKGNPGIGYGSYALYRRDRRGGMAQKPYRLQRIELGDNVTNNQAEYGALIAGLRSLLEEIAARGKEPSHCALEIRGDSRLVMQQLQGLWKTNDAQLRERREEALKLLRRFASYRLKEVPRSEVVAILGH